MKYIYKGALSSVLKLLAVSMFSIFLVACSSSSTEGLTDDGFDFGNDDDDDENGENPDSENLVADDNDNGISNEDENKICRGQGGSDEESSNSMWSDNCQLRANITLNEQQYDHPFSISSYTEGVQRVLYCSGAAGTAASIEAFADGDFGPKTAEAVRTFQENENAEVAANIAAGIAEPRTNLIVDGIVGENTWARLQSKVTADSAYIGTETIGFSTYDVFGVAPSAAAVAAGIDCSQQRNFLGLISDETTSTISSWDMTDAPGGTGIKEFSINP